MGKTYKKKSVDKFERAKAKDYKKRKNKLREDRTYA